MLGRRSFAVADATGKASLVFRFSKDDKPGIYPVAVREIRNGEWVLGNDLVEYVPAGATATLTPQVRAALLARLAAQQAATARPGTLALTGLRDAALAPLAGTLIVAGIAMLIAARCRRRSLN